MKLKLKKALALFLVVCMTAFCAPMAALGAGNGKSIQLVQNGTAANILDAQQSTVWFGNYNQSSNGNSGFNIDPIKWRVLSNADGKLFLLADQNLDVVRYNEVFASVTWETCTLRKWLNGYDGHPYDDTFIGNAFSRDEAAAIAEITVVNDDNPTYNTPGGIDTTDKVFLLSIAEAMNTAYGFTDNNNRVSKNTAYVASGGHTGSLYVIDDAAMWWLRSPGDRKDKSSVVDHDGSKIDTGSYVRTGYVAVRPAFNLNLNSVLFTSPAASQKPGDGTLNRIADYNGNEWKLTLLDESRTFTVTETAATAASAGSVKLNYTGAVIGDNEYISAILADADGSLLYYGRLSQPEAASGSLTVNLPALDLGSYTLKVFNEQYNGNYKTDSASAFAEVSLAVVPNRLAFEAYRTEQKAAADELAKPGDSDACAALITAAKDEIDAIEFDDNKNFAENKAVIDAIMTQLVADLSAQRQFDAYKTAQKDVVDALAQPGDSDACGALISAAKAAVDALDYDKSKTLIGNVLDVSAIVTQLFLDLDAQRVADSAAQNDADLTAFDEYKTAQKTFANALAQPGDSDACAALVTAAKAAVDAFDYDESKTLAVNLLDVSAIVEQLVSDITAQRAADAEAQLAADTAAAEAVEAKIDAIGTVEYSDASKAEIDAARAVYDSLTDSQKALVENYETLTAAEARYVELKAAAETPDTPDDPTEPEQPTKPAGSDQPQIVGGCKWCGELHTGFWGKIVESFHLVFYFWAHLFRLK